MTIELVRPTIEQARRCALYRHFDVSGVLLYIGITESLEARTSGHARGSEWVRFASRAEAEWHDSRESAAEAEQSAIRDEVPVFNRQHAAGDVDRRIAEYVHGREVEALKATIEEYQTAVRWFVSRLPTKQADEAKAGAAHDYFCSGTAEDDAFLAAVLRNAIWPIVATKFHAYNEGRADAIRTMQDFLAEQAAPVEAPF